MPTHPWKMNLLKLPDALLNTVQALKSDDCVVAALKKIPDTDIIEGKYAHLGIRVKDGKVEYPVQILPPPSTGRYSGYNINGREIVLRDEPMTTKTYTIESPNYGDWSNGSHEIFWDRDVYQRESYPPLFLPIRIEQVGIDVRTQANIFKFAVGRTLNRKAQDFEDDLLFDVNLLQENVGTHNVYTSEATSEDFLRSLYVNWEILPPGTREESIARILAGGPTDPVIRAKIADRLEFLLRLRPRNLVKGTSGFARYFGAQFNENLVVFENIEYGNAAYVMREDWQILSHLSRTELLSAHPEKIVRIPHTKTWKHRLKAEIMRR